MYAVAKEKTFGSRSVVGEEVRLLKLERFLLITSFINLFIVAVLGVLLRCFPFMEGFPLAYKNLLHAHSHFAFGGWLMPVLLLLFMKYFPGPRQMLGFVHWRNAAFFFLVSAYGMLLTFPFMGYKTLSIIFSTLSVAAGFYLAYFIGRALRNKELSVPEKFLKAGLFYLVLSSIGPFATGPLIAAGQQGSPLYFNSIYFYLHFQINGWFLFAVMAVVYRIMEKKGLAVNGAKVFTCFHLACFPAFCLSVLWNQPPLVFNIIGGAAALLQMVGLIFFLKDLRQSFPRPALLLTLTMIAFILKNLLQFVSAFPVVAAMAAQGRNFIIAYLHLVLLGFVSLFIFYILIKSFMGRWGIAIFLISFVATEALLVLSALSSTYSFKIPFYNEVILACSLLFPAGILFMLLSFIRPVAARRVEKKNHHGHLRPVWISR